MIINALKTVLNTGKEVDIYNTCNKSDKLFLVLAKESKLSNQSSAPVPTFHVIAQYSIDGKSLRNTVTMSLSFSENNNSQGLTITTPISGHSEIEYPSLKSMNFESDHCKYAECILIFSDDNILQIASNCVGRNKSVALGTIPANQVLSLTHTLLISTDDLVNCTNHLFSVVRVHVHVLVRMETTGDHCFLVKYCKIGLMIESV